ncbi:MAG: MarR family transcriptional regulator [Pseudomonadota bacterium]
MTHESALVVVFNHPGESIDSLRRALGLTHSGTVRLIDTLEAEGLVARARSARDARAVVLRPTAKGRRRAKRVLATRERTIAQVMGSLDSDQVAALRPVIEASLAAMADSPDAARRICALCDETTCRPQGCPVECAVQEAQHTSAD